MVPPGRVMYLRRFKASPNACPIKQEEHRRHANRHIHKPNSARLSSLKQRFSSSDSEASEDESTLRKLKRRLSSSTYQDACGPRQSGDEVDPQQPNGDPQLQHENSAFRKLRRKVSNSSPGSDLQSNGASQHVSSQDSDPQARQIPCECDTPEQGQEQQPQQQQLQRQGRCLLQVQDNTHMDGLLESGRQGKDQDRHQAPCNDCPCATCHDQCQSGDHSQDLDLDERQDQGQQDHNKDQQEGEEEDEHYRQVGLQKPKRPSDSGKEESGQGWGKLKHAQSKRKQKKSLHASLQNPKDLFWDAVWIEPEDIIREVSLNCKGVHIFTAELFFGNVLHMFQPQGDRQF